MAGNLTPGTQALLQNDSNSHSPAKKKKKEKRAKKDKDGKRHNRHNNRSATPLSPALSMESAGSRNEELTLSDGELESKRAALLAQLSEQLDE